MSNFSKFCWIHWYTIYYICFYSIGFVSTVSDVIFVSIEIPSSVSEWCHTVQDKFFATFFGSFMFYLHMFISIRFKMTICQIISKKKMILKLLMLVLNYVKLLRTSVVFHWYKIHHICFCSIGLLSNNSNVIFIILMYQVLCQNRWHTVQMIFFASFLSLL